MYKAKFLLDKSALYTLYCSLILPYLNYCCEIWGSNYFSRIKNVIIMQKKAVRILDLASYRAHTSEIFKKYKLLKFVDIVNMSICITMFKAKNKLLPIGLMHMVAINENVTRQVGLFKVNYRRTKLKALCVSTVGVTLWNTLDVYIRNSRSIVVFKKRYKHCIIDQY